MAKGKGKGRGLRGVNPRDVRTAQSEATIRFGPERSTLSGLISQAQGTLAEDIQAAKSGARSAIVQARRSRPQIRQIYGQALEAANAGEADVQAAFAPLGAAADPFRAATAREQAGAERRIAEAQAGELAGTRARIGEAKLGRQYAKQTARGTYKTTMGELATKLQELGDREGAYITGRLAELQGERLDRKTKLKLQRIAEGGDIKLENLKHQHDLTEQEQKDQARAEREGSGPGGRKPATIPQQQAFTSNFSKALRYAERLKKGGTSRADAADSLITGAPNSADTPGGIPSIKDQVALSAALDLAYNGVVQKDTARRIRRLGISPRILPGDVTISEQLRRARRQGIGQS